MSEQPEPLAAAVKFYVERALSLEGREDAPFAAEMAREARGLADLFSELNEKHGPWIEDPSICAWCPSAWPCPDYMAAIVVAVAVTA